MPEAVVVLLEAVEVEDHERDRLLGAGCGGRLLQVVDQSASVPQSRKGVGQCLSAARVEQLDVLAERDGHSNDHSGQCRHRQPQRQHVLGLDRVVPEQRQTGHGERRGHQQHAPALEPDRLGLRRALPCRTADQQRGRGPQGRDQRGVDGLPGGDVVQEPAVDDRARHERRADQQERAAGPPAGEAEHRHDEAEQEQVADRVGEIDSDHGAVPAASHDRAKDERRGDRRCGECAHHPVEPQARAELPHPLAYEQHDRDVTGGIEGQPQPVADTRYRRRVQAVEEQGVVGLSRGPCEQAGSQHEPRTSLPARRGRAHEAHPRRDEDQRVVDVDLEEAVGAGAVHRPRRLGCVSHQREQRRELYAAHHKPLSARQCHARRPHRHRLARGGGAATAPGDGADLALCLLLAQHAAAPVARDLHVDHLALARLHGELLFAGRSHRCNGHTGSRSPPARSLDRCAERARCRRRRTIRSRCARAAIRLRSAE